MPPRRRKDSLDHLSELFTLLPWWVPLGLAIVAWVAIPTLGRALVDDPGFEQLWPTTRWLAMLALLVAAVLSWVEKGRRSRLVKVSRTLEGLRGLSWREFEQVCAEAYRQQGFGVTETPTGPDGGVDLVLRKGRQKVFVQCKHYRKRQVGVRPVRELYGVMAAGGVTDGLVVTTGSFTKPARDFARGKRLELLDGPAFVALLDPGSAVTPGATLQIGVEEAKRVRQQARQPEATAPGRRRARP